MRYPVLQSVTRRLKDEEGQAIVLVAAAMSIFLIAATGLAVDGAHLYAQRQMAQTAADAAAQAGISSIFTGTATFPTTSSFTCTTTDARTPCKYAAANGFGSTAADTVVIDYPGAAGAPGVALSGDFPVTVLRATITRSVNTTLMRLLGPAASNITTTATAAIVSVTAPVPILVTHPTLASSFSLSGTPSVKICGGPSQSIQVNSNSGQTSGSDAYHYNGNASIDLSHAGPPDPGNCSTGTGAAFGVWGGPGSTPGNVSFGSTGSYKAQSFPIPDPLINVPVPPKPTTAGTISALADNTNGCPPTNVKPCKLYTPGLYTGGINGDNTTPILQSGIYYIDGGGVTCAHNCNMYMATGSAAADTVTGTGWTNNVLFYNTGPAITSGPNTGFDNAGAFNLGANGNVSLVGSPANSVYKNILFFQDRNSVLLNSSTHPNTAHSLGGGGSLTLLGTIYMTNNLATMKAHPADYQEVDLQGNPGSSTLIQGEIIVGSLQLGGNAGITMNLNSTATLFVDQIALVE